MLYNPFGPTRALPNRLPTPLCPWCACLCLLEHTPTLAFVGYFWKDLFRMLGQLIANKQISKVQSKKLQQLPKSFLAFAAFVHELWGLVQSVVSLKVVSGDSPVNVISIGISTVFELSPGATMLLRTTLGAPACRQEL